MVTRREFLTAMAATPLVLSTPRDEPRSMRFGYAAIPEVQEKDYEKIYDEAQAWLDANG